VKAKVLVIVGRRDHTVTPGPAIDFARLLHAELLELDDECGHQYGYCEDDRVQKAVAEFVER
jgi:homoserine O-acetyltransferase